MQNNIKPRFLVRHFEIAPIFISEDARQIIDSNTIARRLFRLLSTASRVLRHVRSHALSRSWHSKMAENATSVRGTFNPKSHGLSEDFRLINFTKLKGWGCKVPQEELLKLLEGLEQKHGEKQIGIGLDSCVLPTRHPGISLVQTTDFFYPLVEDPYMQGKIACANVLSDLYAMGVTECDNMLMLLGVSNQMTLHERQVVTPLVIEGFNDLAREAGTSVNGGQTVLNPWFIVGGVASGVVTQDEFIMWVVNFNTQNTIEKPPLYPLLNPLNLRSLSVYKFSLHYLLKNKLFGNENKANSHTQNYLRWKM